MSTKQAMRFALLATCAYLQGGCCLLAESDARSRALNEGEARLVAERSRWAAKGYTLAACLVDCTIEIDGPNAGSIRGAGYFVAGSSDSASYKIRSFHHRSPTHRKAGKTASIDEVALLRRLDAAPPTATVGIPASTALHTWSHLESAGVAQAGAFLLVYAPTPLPPDAPEPLLPTKTSDHFQRFYPPEHPPHRRWPALKLHPAFHESGGAAGHADSKERSWTRSHE